MLSRNIWTLTVIPYVMAIALQTLLIKIRSIFLVEPVTIKYFSRSSKAMPLEYSLNRVLCILWYFNLNMQLIWCDWTLQISILFLNLADNTLPTIVLFQCYSTLQNMYIYSNIAFNFLENVVAEKTWEEINQELVIRRNKKKKYQGVFCMTNLSRTTRLL